MLVPLRWAMASRGTRLDLRRRPAFASRLRLRSSTVRLRERYKLRKMWKITQSSRRPFWKRMLWRNSWRQRVPEKLCRLFSRTGRNRIGTIVSRYLASKNNKPRQITGPHYNWIRLQRRTRTICNNYQFRSRIVPLPIFTHLGRRAQSAPRPNENWLKTPSSLMDLHHQNSESTFNSRITFPQRKYSILSPRTKNRVSR